jgi:hypothetical protein
MGYAQPEDVDVVYAQMAERVKVSDLVFSKPRSLIPNLQQLYLAAVTFSILNLGCIKLSALFFFWRIFGSAHRLKPFDYATFTSMTIVSLWTVGFVIMTFLQCGTHFAANWTTDVDYRVEVCTPGYPYLNGLAISDFLLDVGILILPIANVSTSPVEFVDMLTPSLDCQIKHDHDKEVGDNRYLSLCICVSDESHETSIGGLLTLCRGLAASCVRMVLMIKLLLRK